MTTSKTANPRKPNKAESVAAALAAARAHLAAREAVLRPRVLEEVAKLTALRLAYDKADEIFDALYAQEARMRVEIRRELGLSNTDVLMAKIADFVISKNLLMADVKRLTREYVEQQIDVTPRWQEHRVKREAASDVKHAAYRKWNVASNADTVLTRLQRELSDLADTVTRLEAELERIPSRNQSARDKRKEAKEEEEAQRQTKAARDLLASEGLSWR